MGSSLLCLMNARVGNGRTFLVLIPCTPSRCQHDSSSHFYFVISAGFPLRVAHMCPLCRVLFSFTRAALPRSHLPARSQHVCHFHTHTPAPASPKEVASTPTVCRASAADLVLLSILLPWGSTVPVDWA